MNSNYIEELFQFIEGSPSCYHVVENMRQELEAEGYQQLLEGQAWEIQEGGKYYVIRNGSALIAFRVPKKDFTGFQIIASHGDSPTFKVKENPEMEAEKHYVKLNVEKYGGMLYSPWFDRPLSVAGRLIVKEKENITVKLVNVNRDFVMIPNLAIHMNKEANDGIKYKVQKDLQPLLGMDLEKGSFGKYIAEAAGVKQEHILGQDLYLYNRMPGSIWGAQNEFISIGKLDDLQCVFASLQGFLEAKDGDGIPVHCVFDNEEVGSGTKQGASSTFLLDTLLRICEGLGMTMSEYRQAVASSFMLSADNAQGVHPNYGEKACPTNPVYLNKGIVIKHSANQKYTTDGISAAVFRELCQRVKVPVQDYFNHSDILGGSTLGNLSGNQVALNTVDIGLAQLAMHSPYETAGAKDTEYMICAAKEFYATSVKEIAYSSYTL